MDITKPKVTVSLVSKGRSMLDLHHNCTNK
jgi:hypothetical protein